MGDISKRMWIAFLKVGSKLLGGNPKFKIHNFASLLKMDSNSMTFIFKGHHFLND